MRTYLDQDKNSEWDEHLNFALLASRVTKNESTGFSPFELLYGRSPRLPLHVQADNQPAFWSPAEEQWYMNNLRILKERASLSLQKAQSNQKRNYNKPCRVDKAKDFRIGDFVLLKNNRARGLDLKYIGPFQILQKIGEDLRIRLQNSGKEKIVHNNRYKFYAPGLVDDVVV